MDGFTLCCTRFIYVVVTYLYNRIDEEYYMTRGWFIFFIYCFLLVLNYFCLLLIIDH